LSSTTSANTSGRVGFNGGKADRAKMRRQVSRVGVGQGTAGGGGGGAQQKAPVQKAANIPAPTVRSEVIEEAPAPTPRLSPAEEKRRELMTKLNPALVALVERLKDKNAKPGADEARFVRDGRAELQVWLTDKSEEAIAQLKQLGFEVVLDPKTAKLVIGRLSVEKLEALAALTFVRYVAPQMSSGQ
ncbi:MAG TPA: hypothetical protein VJT74_12230, partial [Pyrinomonadaceae bacterium]|nr:hypothetical protein [Pyrinomonadaceae bacterium]